MSINSNFDKRRSPRMHIACMVTVHTGRGDYPGLIRNISKTGFGLETTGLFYLGEKNKFEFELPGGPRLKIEGTIARAVKAGQTILYGIRFLPLSMFDAWRLQSFLDKHIIGDGTNKLSGHNT